MDPAVEITFDCLPLRTVGRLDVPLDASEQYEAFCERLKRVIKKHGSHNTYYLHNARCVFLLTNDPDVGMLEFRFDGTALTDTEDQKTIGVDLKIVLGRETCPWLTQPAVKWFTETVEHAVRVEFDRYIAAGDLDRTIKRLEELQAQSDTHQGFMGMGL